MNTQQQQAGLLYQKAIIVYGFTQWCATRTTLLTSTCHSTQTSS